MIFIHPAHRRIALAAGVEAEADDDEVAIAHAGGGHQVVAGRVDIAGLHPVDAHEAERTIVVQVAIDALAMAAKLVWKYDIVLAENARTIALARIDWSRTVVKLPLIAAGPEALT